jgi:hypothetical protein
MDKLLIKVFATRDIVRSGIVVCADRRAPVASGAIGRAASAGSHYGQQPLPCALGFISMTAWLSPKFGARISGAGHWRIFLFVVI